MRKINVQEIAENQVDQWVDEAEAGYDVEALRKRGRPGRATVPSEVVAVRLTEAELAELSEKAASRNLNRSEAIRQALRDWPAA
ncbi:MAG TPA: ribbon-helix-helix protein, CopG family [Candidatus Corynebacterium avicola]|uniref:Ribbon-helix-helix protein, CopG family n=1 Tax=Candidatus Corynebacterium avicola TaxID=2838527 RepID=A0A9D1RLE2_9CORY|nr:ribbon-helix-helix protein, CopG family [Candidatus Corynebacterium avicola]